MKIRTLASVAMALASLTSCGSLNSSTTITVQNYQFSAEPVVVVEPVYLEPPAAAAAAPQLAPKHPTPSCPPYQQPALPKVPLLPLAQLAALGPGNTAKVEEIERQHIEELRAWIEQVQQILNRAQTQYQQRCRLAHK